ncbi:DUF2306 domain-containing protein [Parasphingorhabdus cellanae]|uniref:DUF2306 domain-containing protein n=1 Tax=Parasphingorhabdus cellanae TaxID=2806553 RepID=A0ABX7T208_9SPHN|nr:DUF2306 domain-containing protein [Parasphingorhabdus cellanae]QTD54830.1 DUF2306 domain-containing protein [Parasphingorhabdus cellanae]
MAKPEKAIESDVQKRSGYHIQNIILVVGATLLATLVLMALSSLSGGFAYNAQTEALQQRSMSLPVKLHLATVIPAIPLGAYVLWRKKGDRLHKHMGRIWAVLMVTTAIVSFWIGRPGTGIAGTGFSFIHIFSVVTLVSIPYGIWQIRRGNAQEHYRAMQGPYIGLLIAGLFAFIPGRVLGSLVFG